MGKKLRIFPQNSTQDSLRLLSGAPQPLKKKPDLITTVSTIPGIFLTCVGSDCWVASMILTVGFRARLGEGVGVVGAAADIATRRLPLALLPCPLVTKEVTAPPVEVMNVVLGF